MTDANEVSRGGSSSAVWIRQRRQKAVRPRSSRFPTFRFAHDALIDTNNHARLGQIFGIDIMRYSTEVLRSIGKACLSREVCYGP